MSEPSTFCGLCGAPNPAAAIACVKCGALLAAYRAAPDPISSEQAPTASEPPSDSVDPGTTATRDARQPEPTFADPGGASTELFGQGEIVLEPIELDPLHFEAPEIEPISTPPQHPTNEPIEAEFRSMPPSDPPSPKPEASRPVAVKVEPKASDVPPIPPVSQPMFGSRPPSGKLFVLTLGRQPRWIVIGSLLLLLIACVVIFTGKGVGVALGFCFVTIALLGLITALIVWMRRKFGAKR